MAEAEATSSKGSKLPLIGGLVLAVLLGGGGFYAMKSGLVLGHKDTEDTHSTHADADAAEEMPQVAFVPIQPLLVTVNGVQPPQQLRFEGHLEVAPAHAGEVTAMMPRIMDVMNSYLRAVELSDLRDPAALLRIRVQMLRRIQVVTGEGRVRDLLVTTFLIS